MNIIQFNNSILKFNGDWLETDARPDYNPLNLPPNTIRVKFKSGYTPTMGDSQTLVDSTNNVWDIYKESNVWSRLFRNVKNLTEVLGANTSNVTAMDRMFYATDLSSIALFDTSKVTDMSYMFDSTRLSSVPLFDTSSCIYLTTMFCSCIMLISVPLLDTSSCIDMEAMFDGCGSVQSGALALYQQASSQTNPPSNHAAAFRNCGSGTVTGAAELAQIPSDWKS